MVEHDLAKVGVASSSLVSRSERSFAFVCKAFFMKNSKYYFLSCFICGKNETILGDSFNLMEMGLRVESAETN